MQYHLRHNAVSRVSIPQEISSIIVKYQTEGVILTTPSCLNQNYTTQQEEVLTTIPNCILVDPAPGEDEPDQPFHHTHTCEHFEHP